MLINIGIIVLLGAIAGVIIAREERKAVEKYTKNFKMKRSFKTSKLKYTGGN